MNNDKIYVPNYSASNCAYMYSNNTLRVYESQPQNNATIAYTDYFVDNHYLYRTGTTTFSSYTTLPTCLVSSNITSDFYYRTDFDSILFIFLVLFVFVILIPLKLLSRIFGRWFKLWDFI